MLLPPLLLSTESLPSSFIGRIGERKCAQMQIKPTVRYHLRPTRVIMTKTDNKMEKLEPPTLLVELKKCRLSVGEREQ